MISKYSYLKKIFPKFVGILLFLLIVMPSYAQAHLCTTDTSCAILFGLLFGVPIIGIILFVFFLYRLIRFIFIKTGIMKDDE